MAWIYDLADKAEKVLNDIDKSTAAVLKKDGFDDDDFQPIEVIVTESDFPKTPVVDKPTHRRSFSASNTPVKDLEPDNLAWLDVSNSDQSSNRNVAIVIEKKPDHSKEIADLKEKLSALTTERTWFQREIAELTSTLEKTRSDLNSMESELEQHKARALRTLQERDKIISDLRSDRRSESDESSVPAELNELKQERDALRAEVVQIREALTQARHVCTDSDLNVEKFRQRAIEASIEAREQVANEKRRRLDVEQDLKQKNEEIQSLQEKLKLCHGAFNSKIQKQESEITRLRSQLSAIGTPNTEIESRLTNLTRTLVLKQQELENLVSERNALKLQIEKMESEYQSWRKNLTYSNDTDDAKALLPSFLVESPFDTGVARRVKRAYSSLDATGIRIGVFLRRYPLARIFVILYIALSQLWVIVVLLSMLSDAH